MQAPFELVDGRKNLEKILSEFPAESPHWNEAQNRFHFIDRLLTECLGWEHPNIEVEATDEAGGRSDYLLGRPPKAVLEAKRESRVFKIPPSGNPALVRKLRPLVESCKEFQEAVTQVISYCSLKGAQVGIVCNGPQLALFQSIVIGQSPLDGECFFFNGFDSYKQSFPLLWRFLSPEGISENRAFRELALHRNPRIPPKASTAIPEPMAYRYRNSFQENLRTLASVLLEDIEEHPSVKPAFYRECYVPIEANNRHLLLSKNIISARYKRVGDNGIVPAQLTSANATKGELNIDESILAGAIGFRPIVVIGDVGVGKTSFFENLYEQLDVDEKSNTYFIHVNLGIKATLSEDIKTYILQEIPAILKRKYEVDIYNADFANAIYYSALSDFDKGVHGALKEIDPTAYQKERIRFLGEKVSQRDSHLHASLGHLAQGRKKQIVLIIDNADQRRFETQQEAFLIAQELAASRNLLVFVAIRPSTFYQSKLSGALSGYQNKVLTIAPPPADQVLEKRITFAVRVAEGKIAPAALTGIKLHLNNIVLFLNATLRSIRENEKIRIFLSNITGGNTRMVIELISGFCGSPNVDSEKIVRIEGEEGNYKVPLHEFTKHALLGEYAYYNPQSSLVACNVYDVSSADPREHFLASTLVAFLASSLGLKDNDGFISGNRIMQEMVELGFLEDQVRHTLRRLASHRLIETPHGHYRELSVDEADPAEQYHFRATSIGVYHIRYWATSFSFLDATSTDTPIFDLATREAVFRTASSFEIADRYQRALDFRQYLESQWHAANINVNYFDFVSILQTQDDSFSSVRVFLERRQNKRHFWRR